MTSLTFMADYCTKNVDCALCGANTHKVLDDDGPIKVVKCRACGLVYTNPQPVQDGLAEYYEEKDHLQWLEGLPPDRKKAWENRFNYLQRQRFEKVKRYKEPGAILDVGCGCGYFLEQAKAGGWSVRGVELSGSAAKYAKDVFGIEAFHGELKNAGLPDNSFDVVTFWHVLEHTADPLGTLIEARRILKPDGLLIVAAPNVRSYIYKAAYALYRFKPFGVAPKDVRIMHLYHFSADTLGRLLRKTGLTPIRYDINMDRTLLLERILDGFAWMLQKTIGVNFGIALEVYARKI